MITKMEVHLALTKYRIFFGFPNNAKTGEIITCYLDLYKHNGDTEKLRLAILADDDCSLTVSETPANYLASLRLEYR